MKSTAPKAGWLAKVQAYIFYVLRSTSRAAWNDGLEDWKALAIMSFSMASVLLTIVCVVAICLQRRVLLPSGKLPFVTLWSGVMMGLAVFNHYSLVFERRWSRFEREFQQQSNVMRVIGSITVWVIVVLIVLVAEWTGSIAFKLPTE